MDVLAAAGRVSLAPWAQASLPARITFSRHGGLLLPPNSVRGRRPCLPD